MKPCCTCRAWRTGIAPLSTRVHGIVCNIAGGIGNNGCNATSGIRCVGLLFCSSKNNSSYKVFLPDVGSRKKSVLKRKSPLEATTEQQYSHRFWQDCLQLYSQYVASSCQIHCHSVEVSIAASLGQLLPLLQSLCTTLPINYSSGLGSQILE